MLSRLILVLVVIFSFALTAEPNCKDCHQATHKQWQQSDHAKSLMPATANNVLANFNQTTLRHAKFYQQKQKFIVDIDNKSYEVKYAVGHYPLQQYLVETEIGRLQVLPYSWDARTKSQGGQRWYLHNSQGIKAHQRLHWQQPLQNYNGMCADCHSQGLQRNYEVESNQFNSQWQQINVNCLSCHSEHDEKPQKPTQFSMESCFACHSLRTPLSDGFSHDRAFLDQFTPQLLTPQMYHPDGQIKEEVYVYGSFLQSKMYQAGVACLDCHDAHTMQPKRQGNDLCLQCHESSQFNHSNHHHHKNDSTGAQCVNCHMPHNRYMGVDDRRDHSIKIPRPDLSIRFNTPNACTQCHNEKSNQWAKQQLHTWFGEPAKIATTKLNLMRLLSQNPQQKLTLAQHQRIIEDQQLDEFSRASALNLLHLTTSSIDHNWLSSYIQHPSPLIRMAAATATNLATSKHIAKPLLTDKYGAVRVAAANALKPQEENKAKTELLQMLAINSWRAESRHQLAVIAAEQGKWQSAQQQLHQAIEIDPYYGANYLNLAELYRLTQQIKQEANILQQAINKMPKHAEHHYQYGLFLVRQKRIADALTAFKRAVKLEPQNQRYDYAYQLALQMMLRG